MAVITFDVEKNSVCVLVEKSDIVNTKEDNIIEVSSGSRHISGKVFVNGEIDAFIVRGER